MVSFDVILFLQVDWDSEQQCFQTFAEELSRFYAFGPDPFGEEDNVSETAQESSSNDISPSLSRDTTWKWTVEHVLFSNFRSGLLPPKHFSEDGTFLQIAHLPDLYKVFERC